MARLQQEIDSRHFTELKAYKRRNTLNWDTYYAAFQLARTVAHDPPEVFIPIAVDESELRKHKAAQAEDQLDRRTEDS